MHWKLKIPSSAFPGLQNWSRQQGKSLTCIYLKWNLESHLVLLNRTCDTIIGTTIMYRNVTTTSQWQYPALNIPIKLYTEDLSIKHLRPLVDRPRTFVGVQGVNVWVLSKLASLDAWCPSYLKYSCALCLNN